MQITVQMLDGSVTPFRVRSSITIASLKAKFEPWQSMKGRALLHHAVRLDNRLTLGSIPGVKDGTILRVVNQMPQTENKSNVKTRVMIGPASLAVDEDVVESIEMSDDDEEMMSDNDPRLSGNKRERTLMTPAAVMEDFIVDDNIANTPLGKTQVPREMNAESIGLPYTNRGIAQYTTKREGRPNASHERNGTLASEAQNLSHHPDSLKNIFTQPPYLRTPDQPIPSPPHLTETPKPTFLAGINAAATEMHKSPPTSKLTPRSAVPINRCDACGRVCGCHQHSSVTASGLAPVEGRVGGFEIASTNSGRNGRRRAVDMDSLRQCEESSWTGM